MKRLVLPVCSILLWGITGCEDSASRQEKALRVQLGRALRHHSYESALPLARRLIEAAPQDNSAWKHLVKAQLGLGDLDGAKQTLAQWRKVVRSPSPRLDEYEGDIAQEEHDTARALQSWAKALNRQPKNRRTLEKIALLEQSQRHWSEANRAWSALLQIEDDEIARVNRAACRRRLREWNGALEDLHRAQKLAPDDPEVQHWSKLFEKLGKFLDEIRALDARISAGPADAVLLADRALLLLRSGDPELALDDCESAVKLAPWAAGPKLFQAMALIALNRSNECERLSIREPLRLEALTPEFLETMNRLDSAISVERNNAEHYTARAWQLSEIAQPMLALEDAETAARLDPKSASAWAEVGYALMKLGRAQEASQKIKHATELDPTLASAWEYRGELELAGGDSLAAIDSLSRALAIQQTVAGLQKREECYRRLGLQARADEDHRAMQQLTASTLK
jgi:tetratricopeptide (TPR) repeat protein